ncbi:MAG: hypothetical protein WCG75_04960 [Armatimonadota bacterium]
MEQRRATHHWLVISLVSVGSAVLATVAGRRMLKEVSHRKAYNLYNDRLIIALEQSMDWNDATAKY